MLRLHEVKACRIFCLLLAMTVFFQYQCYQRGTFPWNLSKEDFSEGFLFGLLKKQDGNLCFPKWPSMELFLPVPPDGDNFHELDQMFLPSLALFWPFQQSKTRLLILTDGDSKVLASKAKLSLLQLAFKYNISRYVDVKFNTMPEKLELALGGHDRQQLLMFWADNFTRPETEYVAFVDSDSYFVSPVMFSDVFSDGLPIVRPLFGKGQTNSWFETWPRQSERSIGRKEPFTCMCYFPVVIKVSHLPEIREHVRRTLNASSFNKAFEILAKGSRENEYSQFNIMCSFMWWYRRNVYNWQVAQLFPNYTGPLYPGQVETLEEAGIPAEFLRQTPRVTTHKSRIDDAVKIALKSGVCYGLSRSANTLEYCERLVPDRLNAVNIFEWTFEGSDYSANYPEALAAHRERLRRIELCPLISAKKSAKLLKVRFSNETVIISSGT